MHPVLRRTGELSKLQLSDLLPSAVQAQTRRQQPNPRYLRWAASEQGGLSDAMYKVHTRPDHGESLQELFHSLFDFLARAIPVRLQRRRGKSLREGSHGL